MLLPAVRVQRSADPVADGLRGFGPAGVLTVVVVLLAGNIIGPVLALAWAWRSRTPWSEIGFAPPRNWFLTVAAGILAGVALKLVMKALVMPLFGAPEINPAYHYLAGNNAALPGTLIAVVLRAGVGEEIVWRGFLFERLRTLLGSGAGPALTALLISSALFGLGHYPDQGLAGVEQAAVVGLVYGGMFLATGRLWLSMATHAAFNVTAVLIIYWNLESEVARFIFR